jgi:environmental stress-induced protein Ves
VNGASGGAGGLRAILGRGARVTMLRRLTAADATRLPWKNGRGETTQIALWPPSASFARGDFDWRLSRAAVDEPSPFSAFPGFDRVLVIVGGEGLDLQHGEIAPAAHVAAWVPYAFSGDWPTTASVPTGPVRDLNVLTRRDRVGARVRVLDAETARAGVSVAGDHVLIHGVAGHAVVAAGAEGARIDLGPFDTLWLADATAPSRLEFVAGDAALRVVVIELAVRRPF